MSKADLPTKDYILSARRIEYVQVHVSIPTDMKIDGLVLNLNDGIIEMNANKDGFEYSPSGGPLRAEYSIMAVETTSHAVEFDQWSQDGKKSVPRSISSLSDAELDKQIAQCKELLTESTEDLPGVMAADLLAFFLAEQISRREKGKTT